MNWAGSAFVWVPGNVPLTGLPPWIKRLFVQLCSGTQPSEQQPDQAWVTKALDAGFDVAAWHWCTAEDPEAEAAYHAQTTRSYGIQTLVANLEEPYDAHGNSQDAKYHLPGRYLAALAWDGPLGVTSTPRFASDMTGWRDAGAINMPQSFPTAAEGGDPLPTVVQHAEAWGWPRSQIRPLVQTYEGAGGKRPNAQEQNHQAAELDVGVTPYTVEQSIGSPALEQLRNAIERPTSGQQPPAPPDEGDDMDWYEKPYPGGPMVKVDGFPRPLYPPDAKGYRPSADGPDVVAYKRTVSRAGRWPWQTFDDTYSNGFSHGKSGNVKETGVAGIQRQAHLDATGYIGKKTFNLLRSISIPDGLPHAGEPAMDARAAELINQAYAMFEGAEPAGFEGTLREAALELAISQLGYTESPSGSNRNKYGAWYGMDGQPWCAMFVTWAYETNPHDQSPSFAKGSRYAYCPYIVADARAGKNGLQTTDDPIPGDLVLYDWSSDTEYDHIGLFEKQLDAGNFQAIEGNTSTSNNSNGGQVMRRTRNRSGQGTVFVRVTEP